MNCQTWYTFETKKFTNKRMTHMTLGVFNQNWSEK
jgi:hypothetical protein